MKAKMELKNTVLSIFLLKGVREMAGRNEFRGDACSLQWRCAFRRPEVKACECLTGWQEEVASYLATPNSCKHSDLPLRISLSHPVPFPSPLQIWVRKTSDSTKMRIYLGQLQRGLFVIRRRSAAWLSPVLFFPCPLFWNGFWFCFALNRKFLTWDLLLAWPWKMENTVVDSARRPCGQVLPAFVSFFPCLDFFQSSVTMRLFYFQENWEFALLISLFFACTLSFFFFKASFEFEGTSLLIICRSCCHEEREGVPSSVHFHVLNLISGSCSYLPCQAQFTVSPEAWGRGPSRRRLILLALSLLGEMNALCNIWRMPSIPPAERQKNSPGRRHALQ